MSTRLNFGLIDNNGEKGFFNLPVAEANTGVAFESAKQAQGDIAISLAALSLGVLGVQSFNATDTLSTDRSTETYAHRETAVRFVMVDGDANQVVASLPAPDLAKFPFVTLGQDTTPYPYVSINADVSGLVALLETYGKHPITGGALTVIRLDFVGRNN